jgi:hypothetical protein
MRKRNLASLFVLSILLAACTTPTSLPPSVETESPVEPAPSAAASTPYPEPFFETPEPLPVYPEPVTPGIVSPKIPSSGYEPQPGDKNLQRDKVLVDLEGSTIFIKPSDPTQVYAILNGTLSDPCHELRVVVTPPDASKTINVDVYSVVDTSVACIMVIEPFSATIPLGSYTNGEYTVGVNGEQLGTFVGGYGIQPGDSKLIHGDVSLDIENSQLFISDSQPRLVSAILQVELPNPCYQLRILNTQSTDKNQINLEVYGLYDPRVMCTEMIQPEHITYLLGSFTSGHYSVYVNGQLLGEFDG